MRRDYFIAILLALAAIPLGAAMMAAPEYLHLTGYLVLLTFWGGIALGSALIGLAAFVALRGGREAESLAVSPHSHSPRDVPLVDAIWRAHLGVWGKRAAYVRESDDEWAFHGTVGSFRQLARDGRLPIWGTKIEDGAPFEPIPLSFWSTHALVESYSVDPLAKDVFVCVTEPTKVGQTRHARTREWTNFMTSREIVEKLWPPKDAG